MYIVTEKIQYIASSRVSTQHLLEQQSSIDLLSTFPIKMACEQSFLDSSTQYGNWGWKNVPLYTITSPHPTSVIKLALVSCAVPRYNNSGNQDGTEKINLVLDTRLMFTSLIEAIEFRGVVINTNVVITPPGNSQNRHVVLNVVIADPDIKIFHHPYTRND